MQNNLFSLFFNGLSESGIHSGSNVCILHLISLICLSSFSDSRIQRGKWPVFLCQRLYRFLQSCNLDGLGNIYNFTVDPDLWNPYDHAAYNKQQIWWSQRSSSVSSSDRIAMDLFNAASAFPGLIFMIFISLLLSDMCNLKSHRRKG